jgi:plasmid stability protein
MSTIVVRNLPDHLHALLKQRAEQNHRSMTKEVVHLIEAGLQATPARRPLPPPVKLRSGRMLSIDEIEAAIAEGQK